MQGIHRCSRCGFTTSLRLMGALSLTAAAVSGLELPAWPDRHVRSQSHCLSGSGRTHLQSGSTRMQPGPRRNFVQLSPVRGTCGTCVRARLCARTAPGIRTHGGSVYDERLNRYAIYASGQIPNTVHPDAYMAYRLSRSSMTHNSHSPARDSDETAYSTGYVKHTGKATRTQVSQFPFF